MKKFFRIAADHPKFVLVVLAAAATLGVFAWRSLAVDVFPDISVPRVTIQTEAGGLTAEEVELLADGMSEILGTDRAFILERAQNKKSFYQVIKTRVDKESADAA